MTEANKITDLCYTASFLFDRLADISMQVHDLEKESIKTPITVEDIERNVIKFNAELEDVPRMNIKELRNRTSYVPRRNAYTRPLESYRPNNPYYQMPSSYRLVSSNTASSGRIFSGRNDQMGTQTNPVVYRKRPANEDVDNSQESKQQVRGIKWVAAKGEDVQNSGLNLGNLAKSTVVTAARREYATMSTNSSMFNQQNQGQAGHGNYQIWPKSEPLSPIRSSRPFSAGNVPTNNLQYKTLNEDDAAVNSLLMSFNENNESEASSGVEF